MDRLQELRDSFYADVAAYLDTLREERARVAAEAEDPFSASAVTELSEEIETAQRVAEAIYERRIGKLVTEATLTATGNGSETTGLTAEEEALYEDLVDRIRQNEETVLSRIGGGGGTEIDGSMEFSEDSSASRANRGPLPPSGTSAADSNGQPGDQPDPNGDGETSVSEGSNGQDDLNASEQSGEDAGGSEPDESVELTTVRLMTDVGEILGVDAKEYDLREDEVVDLPRENAEVLLERGAAEEVE